MNPLLSHWLPYLCEIGFFLSCAIVISIYKPHFIQVGRSFSRSKTQMGFADLAFDKRMAFAACIVGVLVSLKTEIPMWVALILGVILGLAIPNYWAKRAKQQFRMKFDRSLAESLQTIGSSLKSGLTLKDSLMVAVDNCPEVFARTIADALKQYRFGVPIEAALDHVRCTVGTANARIAFGAMIISSQLGGNLPLMLQRIIKTMRERERVEGKLKSLTAQGRAQAVLLCSAPPALGIGMYLYDPAKRALLVDSVIGQALLATAVILEVIGILVTIRVMKLEV